MESMKFSAGVRKRYSFATANHGADIQNINTLVRKYGLKVNRTIDAPTVTTYEIDLNVDTKIKSVLNLEPNFAIAVNDQRVRVYQDGNKLCIEKKGADNEVIIADLLNDRFENTDKSKLLCMIGIDTTGTKIYYDLNKAPHMLIAGTTGSGKSIMEHLIFLSLLMNHPADVDYIAIDPKGSEFKTYGALGNVTWITDTYTAVNKLKYLCDEMETRYDTLSRANARDIQAYRQNGGKMKDIVVIIDEFADLMLTSGATVEDYTVRLAQKARACGIHLIIATQSPRRDVITGLIAANMPTRLALAVNDQIESRIALGRKGAEKLNGKGDMLFLPNGYRDPIRVQGANVLDVERSNIVGRVYLIQNPHLKSRYGFS